MFLIHATKIRKKQQSVTNHAFYLQTIRFANTVQNILFFSCLPNIYKAVLLKTKQSLTKGKAYQRHFSVVTQDYTLWSKGILWKKKNDGFCCQILAESVFICNFATKSALSWWKMLEEHLDGIILIQELRKSQAKDNEQTNAHVYDMLFPFEGKLSYWAWVVVHYFARAIRRPLNW